MDRIEQRLAAIEEKLQGLIEINDRLVHENIRKSTGTTTTVATPSAPKTQEILIEKHNEDTIRVSGKTYPHRSLLREANGEWDKVAMCWVIQNEHKDTLIGLFQSNNVEFKASI